MLRHLGPLAGDGGEVGRLGVLELGGRAQQLGQGAERQLRELGDVVAGEGHRQRLRPQPLAVADRAGSGLDVLQGAPAHRRALRVRQRVADVAFGAREGAVVVVVGVDFGAVGMDFDRGLLVGEEDPVAVLAAELPPGLVDVVAERDQDVAQVLALPGPRPGGDRALADRQRGVGDERLLGDVVDGAEAVALAAGADRGVRREPVGVQHLLGPRRVGAGAGEQHPQRVGERRHGADAGARGGAAAPLLQGDRRRQPGDLAHLGRVLLVEQAPRVRRHRLEVAPLRLGVDRPEGERGLARAGDAGEHGQRVARRVDVDVAEVVLLRPAHGDEAVAVARRGRHREHATRRVSPRRTPARQGDQAHARVTRLTPPCPRSRRRRRGSSAAPATSPIPAARHASTWRRSGHSR